jgi:hypothetical protein
MLTFVPWPIGKFCMSAVWNGRRSMNQTKNHDDVSVPTLQSHIEELERRLKRYMAHPEDLLSLKELHGRIEGKKLITP